MKKIANAKKDHIFITNGPFETELVPEMLSNLHEGSMFSVRMNFKESIGALTCRLNLHELIQHGR
jgi:hypothetical protein